MIYLNSPELANSPPKICWIFGPPATSAPSTNVNLCPAAIVIRRYLLQLQYWCLRERKRIIYTYIEEKIGAEKNEHLRKKCILHSNSSGSLVLIFCNQIVERRVLIWTLVIYLNQYQFGNSRAKKWNQLYRNKSIYSKSAMVRKCDIVANFFQVTCQLNFTNFEWSDVMLHF